MTFDAKFHAFMLVASLLEKVLPAGTQLTSEQGDAVHATAKQLAKDLTNGDYVYEDKH